jgi:hypothetical protein
MLLVLKLTTGEEIVADTEKQSGQYLLKNAMRYIPTPAEIAMVPIAFNIKSHEVTIDSQHVLFTAEPDDELVNKYNAETGGIVLPPSNIQLV